MSALPRVALVYRAMTMADLESVCAIEQRIYSFPWTRGNFVDSIHSGYFCTVAEYGGVIAGYGIFTAAAGESHLLNLSIDERWQRHGYGRALLLHHVNLARSLGASSLLLEVRPSNTAARALYAAEGFEQIAVRHGYYPAGDAREDALLLRLPL
jgi:ribosomal-protein-alanine N-acetyltransferase